jgi:hypothetical protein
MNNNINMDELVDIRDVHVDKALPKTERVAEFVRQIRNPHHFRCGKFTVTARFAEDGPTLEECLQRIIA